MLPLTEKHPVQQKRGISIPEIPSFFILDAIFPIHQHQPPVPLITSLTFVTTRVFLSSLLPAMPPAGTSSTGPPRPSSSCRRRAELNCSQPPTVTTTTLTALTPVLELHWALRVQSKPSLAAMVAELDRGIDPPMETRRQGRGWRGEEKEGFCSCRRCLWMKTACEMSCR